MDKIELKHLAGYLPYALTGVRHGYGKMGVNYIYNPSYDNDPIMMQNPIKGISSSGSLVANFNNFKPILRPLSDLTKEIEVNGELIDVYDVLEELGLSSDIRWILCNDLSECKYATIQKLYEWHFDLHGLIEKGLAIDINTLEK